VSWSSVRVIQLVEDAFPQAGCATVTTTAEINLDETAETCG